MKFRAALAVLTLLSMTACAGGPQRNEESSVAFAARPVAQQLPHVLWAPADLARLRRGVDATLTSPYFAHAGVAIADASGRIVYGKNATRAYAPASTFKTIVAATALTTLGPEAHLSTTLASIDRPNEAGTIDDLWLVGGGDPSLDPDQLHDGVAALYR
ncbi:MAG: D-alanyl-D-alanine carboxypeptidase, partial [Polyangiaceae bacterium]